MGTAYGQRSLTDREQQDESFHPTRSEAKLDVRTWDASRQDSTELEQRVDLAAVHKPWASELEPCCDRASEISPLTRL
ncbi:MAG: hypothetical protein CMN91_09625 [Synechococcus sp. ARS1019]|nr:hypothetical protein [Synechococcus sp. ARS1019]